MASVSTTPRTGSRKRGATGPRVGAKGARLDLATTLGVCGGFALIAMAMVLGGSPAAFADLPAMLIVLGGTLTVTTISYSLREIAGCGGVILKAVFYRQREPSEAALQMLALADLARRNGALALENREKALREDPFLYRAMRLVIDGAPGEEVERMMTREAEAMMARHDRAAGVLRRAGEVAPAMGLIGTLVGLVQMLGRLDDPASIGPAMAVALLTTFYGAILAHMVFLPIANKLERNSGIEDLVNRIYAQGSASLARQENPRRLEMNLNTILPPARRVSYFD